MTTTPSSTRPLGYAAAYLAAALVAAMFYFLVGTDYPSVTDPSAKVDLLVQHELGIHVTYLIAYVGFGLVLAVLALGLSSRMAPAAPTTARVAGAVGVIWAGMLVASGMVFVVGMGSVVDLAATDPGAAVSVWQAIEPVAAGLGGAGGEILGGTWVLLVSLASLRGHLLPTWLMWLGVVVGAAGILSTVPGLAGIAVLFRLLVIIWLTGLAVVLLREDPAGSAPSTVGQLVETAR